MDVALNTAGRAQQRPKLPLILLSTLRPIAIIPTTPVIQPQWRSLLASMLSSSGSGATQNLLTSSRCLVMIVKLATCTTPSEGRSWVEDTISASSWEEDCIPRCGLSGTRQTGMFDDMAHTILHSTTLVPHRQFFALKILSLDSTENHRSKEMLELEVMRYLRDTGKFDSLPRLRGDFELEVSSGKSHICLVMDLLGMDIATLRRMSHYKALPHCMVRRILCQVVQAIAQLHCAGIVHTGEFDRSFTWR